MHGDPVKALVTGANGFIGSRIALNLLSHGYQVRALVRPDSDHSLLDDMNVEIAHGDLTQPESLRSALQGCQYLIHTAADYRLWAADPQEIYAANVDGTKQLMALSLELGVERVVYTSSVATLGLHPDRPSDENSTGQLERMIGHYKRSKFLAEQAVVDIHAKTGLPVVIVSPSAPVGPGDLKPTPTGQTILDATNGRIPAFLDTGLNIVHVDDVAEGHYLALTRGEAGRRYILGGEDMTLQQILETVAQICGRRAPKIKMPYAVALTAGHVCEVWARVTGKPPAVPLEGVRMARHHMFFCSARAQQELGYQARPAKQAIRDAVAWFAEQQLSTTNLVIGEL